MSASCSCSAGDIGRVERHREPLDADGRECVHVGAVLRHAGVRPGRDAQRARIPTTFGHELADARRDAVDLVGPEVEAVPAVGEVRGAGQRGLRPPAEPQRQRLLHRLRVLPTRVAARRTRRRTRRAGLPRACASPARSRRRARSGGRTARRTPRYSSRDQPTPIPRSSRPPDTQSRVAACLAV